MLYLHGWGGNASAFLFCAKALSGEMRGVCVDFAGFGESPEPERPYTVADYAAETLALMDGEGIRQFAVVGHSFGGRVALELAARHPERISALVLVDAAGLKPRRKPSYYLRVAAHKLLRKLGGKGLAGSSDYRRLSPVMKETFVRVVNYDQTSLLPYVRCPAAIFWGRDDADTPFYMAKKFERGISGAHLFVLEGGHFAYLSDPKFFPVLKAFLEGTV